MLYFLNSLEYIKENQDIIDNLIHILINNDSINTITYVLEILVLICNYWKEEGAKMVYNSLKAYSLQSNTKLFKEFIEFIDDNNADTKKTAITIICLMIKYTNDKEQQANLVADLNDVGLLKILEKNAHYQDSGFQNQLSLYQKLTDEIVKGSNYQVQNYLFLILKYFLNFIGRNIQEKV